MRGLDYYTRTVFEIQPPEEGGQSNICGGGRYDGLIQELGGPPTPGIGFGSGLERMILNIKRQNVRPSLRGASLAPWWLTWETQPRRQPCPWLPSCGAGE